MLLTLFMVSYTHSSLFLPHDISSLGSYYCSFGDFPLLFGSSCLISLFGAFIVCLFGFHCEQQDFGFCWGVERSIALAYEAVEHYPDKTLHITNELIHNPEVNDALTNMKVNLIEKVGEGKKDFSTIEEGDVVILPAFGASYEEMEMLDKKVGPGTLSSE